MVYIEVPIYTHTHIVSVQLRLGFLCLEGLLFVTSLSAFQMFPLVNSIFCKSMFSHVRSAAFSLLGRFSCALKSTFQ